MTDTKQQSRYIQNDMPMQTLATPPSVLLQNALEHFVQANPPKTTFVRGELYGLFGGMTGVAYMLLQLSELYPDVKVNGDGLRQWAERYLGPERSEDESADGCGLFNEKLSYDAVRACLSGKDEDVDKFLGHFAAFTKEAPAGEEDAYESEILYGRAGLLYMLRAVRHWVPSSSDKVEAQTKQVADMIRAANSHGKESWTWNGHRIAGAAHGDIGIITQLVLSQPALATELEAHVQRLLKLQAPNGNWPKYTDKEEAVPEVVQFCHGSPGFVYSLRALRPYYPNLHGEIDAAIAKGQEITWKEGLLRKAPALCHGIPGNALALPLGPKRDHFLSLVTPEATEKAKQGDPEIFGAANYGLTFCIPMSYELSAIWLWAVCEREDAPFLFYTDV